MSKKANLKSVESPVVETAVEVPTPPSAVPVLPMSLQEVDRLTLELAKANRQTALAKAKQALAENENAELSYKYIVLQLYMKYGLNENDAIGDDGKILRGQASQVKSQG